ncbi:nuclear transport factor 2 family protein [Olivibacter sp. SDN3]|uniref:nuclear transport factor 2 family protein n=1 Tax=Olivibacter sp. SDN3 TaxID=2764720 RepID=UPI001650ECD9|nr:nuclear transport factor 2 family protein [Olivibacter sp. SDN3]QNL50473.1 nuclear transport factor 2 family protein [Olivibacter sp. SDN3]
MKTLIRLFFAAIIISATAAFARAETKAINKVASASVVDRYIEIVAKGNTLNVEAIFSNQFTQQVANKGKVVQHNRAQVIGFLKKQPNIQQNCETAYTMIEQGNDSAIAKVEMQYEGFTRVEYVTLSNEGGRWKVSQVLSTYQ